MGQKWVAKKDHRKKEYWMRFVESLGDGGQGGTQDPISICDRAGEET